MSARAVMVQGTASSVGKSVIAAALCRMFLARGLRVAPFKSQNMALNSFVTPEGLEIGRAQAVQAEAARVAPRAEMNPILLKPEHEMRMQVVLMGKPLGSMTFLDYHTLAPKLLEAIERSLKRLREEFDLIVIEGAGSPAEINLKSRDLANMRVAEIADAKVILVGDIDRGGVFAHFVGTMELLDKEERARVAALLINRFRGDKSLLRPGIEFLESRLRIPVLGVVPFIERLRIADEDSVALEDRRGRRVRSPAQLDIAVVRLPAISNYDDFLALEHEPRVVVRFVESAPELDGADLVVIPGSKTTVADLEWMRERGIADAIVARARSGAPVLGICAGCQMLGEAIEDPEGVESAQRTAPGLKLLELRTRFAPTKLTAQAVATLAARSFVCDERARGAELSAYEIHMGMVERTGGAAAPFKILRRNGAPAGVSDGAISRDGTVVGTMLHGILENSAVRAALIANLRARRGLAPDIDGAPVADREAEYDRLASAVRENINLELLDRIAGLA